MPARCESRAPAKVILLGEHWVVVGGRALAASIGLYAVARCEALKGGGVVAASRQLGVEEELLKSCRRLCWLREAVLAASQGSPWPARVVVDSEIPMGAGLGSSAAVAAAFAACYLCLRGRVDPGSVSQAAFAAERIVHGNPSGVDNTVSSYGGLIVYRRGEGVRRLEGLLPGDAALLVVDTGVSRSTRVAVERFTSRFRRLGPVAARLLEAHEALVDEALAAMRRGDLARLGEIMDVAQGMLNAMGVSSPVIEEAVARTREAGALGAKLTGAGMGGAVIALATAGKAARIRERLASAGLRVYQAPLGVTGVEARPLG